MIEPVKIAVTVQGGSCTGVVSAGVPVSYAVVNHDDQVLQHGEAEINGPWVLNLFEEPKPPIDPEWHAEAAMCLWEEVLGILRDPNHKHHAALEAQREAGGTSELRMSVLALTEACNADYAKAQAEGYDDSFDWDFVPGWLDQRITTTGI